MNSLLSTKVQTSVYIPLIGGLVSNQVAGSDIPTQPEFEPDQNTAWDLEAAA